MGSEHVEREVHIVMSHGHGGSRAPSRAPSKVPSPPSSPNESHHRKDEGSPARSRTQSSASSVGDYKRLVVCCDGTWLDSAQGLDVHGNLIPPSNVTRMTRAIRAISKEGIPQIVYYQAGVGSSGTVGNKVVEGLTGAGLADNVREAYSFIANNWIEGDEIFLIGFSRGAFTARSVAGLIANVGVMTKAGLPSLPVVFKDFAHRNQRRYRSPQPNVPFPDKPPFRDPIYVQEMQRRGLTTLRVRIRAIGVFDTVGSLGVPQITILNRLRQARKERLNEYSFYDTELDTCIDNAFQALALDEKRDSFQPALWEKKRNERTNLVQVWFPGCHTNIGGGYDDQELANITLAWMMSMFDRFLDLNINYILKEEQLNREYYASHGRSARPWSFGRIYDSMTGVFAIGGSTIRTPGNYERVNPGNGDSTGKLLRNTHEYIHVCVRTRMRLRGPGYDDRGTYDPPALRDYKLRTDAKLGQRVSGIPTGHFWEQENGHILPEAPLRDVEKLLLSTSPDIDE